MTIAVGSDHAGLPLKAALVEHLTELGYATQDYGTHSEESCDYPDIASAVAHAVADGGHDLGVLICGTGLGMSITANKVPGAYAALCCYEYTAHMARSHNAANILCLGGRVTGLELAKAICTTFVTTPPSDDERHLRRRAKVAQLETTRQ